MAIKDDNEEEKSISVQDQKRRRGSIAACESPKKDQEYFFLKLPLGTSNQHLIEKIAVISEKSDSSFDSDSSIDISEDDEYGSCGYSQQENRLVYLMVP